MSPRTPLANPFARYALALALIAAALGLRMALQPWVPAHLPFVTLFGAVALTVWVAGTGPSILAAGIGFIVSTHWMFGEVFAPRLSNPTYVAAALVYTVSCAAIIALFGALHRTQRRLRSEIDERRQVETSLRDSEDHYRHAVELSPQITWTARPDGSIERMADRWREWSGKGGLEQAWVDAVHPDDRAHACAAWSHAVATGQPYDTEYRLVMGDGRSRWVRSRAYARRDAQQRTVRWYGTTEDVDERKRAEHGLTALNATLEDQVRARTSALQASEARLRAIFSTSLLYQGLLSRDGTLLAANAASLRGIDAQLEDVLGKPYWDTPWFTATPGAAALVREGVQAAAEGRDWSREIVVDLPGGRRTFDFAMRPVLDEHGAVVSIVPEAMDITQRREAEDRLRQAQKMEAVGQLTGGIAHDFNNVLQVISTNLHLIARQPGAGAAIAKHVADAHNALERGARMASQLLAFGRRQALAPKVLDVGRFVAGLTDMLRRALGERVLVDTHTAVPGCHAYVDATQFENALLNLALNARDAMNGHGRLVIEVDLAALPDGDAAEHVRIAVRDEGSGMPPEVVAQAFDPFFSTKPVGRGTGLGLSMVYGFVRQSGGQVKIDSELQRGTTVTMYLPRATQAEQASSAEQPPPAGDDGPVTGGAELVLVVEDDAAVRGSTVQVLRELGYRVLEAADAASAAALIDGGAAVDLVFTDVVMPGEMRATDLARRARQRRPGVAVLYTSGYTRNIMSHGGRLDEGIDLLAKPYTRDALARRIRGVLDAHRAAHERRPATQAERRCQVLLVEDDEGVRSSTAETLRDLGHDVVAADSAEQAVPLLGQRRFDVLMVDVRLPGMPGELFAAEARTVWPDIRIVFCTGSEDFPDGRAAGAGPVLLRKPYDREAIAAALRDVLRS